MILKKIYISILQLFSFVAFFSYKTIALNAQTNIDQENLKKYWTYRARFLGHDGEGGFIKLGLEKGMSIPASGRNFDLDCQYFWLMSYAKCTEKPGKKGLMTWGDGTYYLGYYLLNLSLEYANLKRAKQNTDFIIEEIFYALKAFERLDYEAELALGLEKGVLNGFFLRDDVPQDFFEKYPAMNIKEKMFYGCVHSDYSCHKVHVVNSGAYVSQDQIIALMLGFAGVVQFVEDASYEVNGDLISLKELAELYTHRMVDYLITCKWKIKAPNGEKIGDRWGGNVLAFNYNIAKSAHRICQGRFQPTYQTGMSKFTGRAAKGSFNWGWALQAKHNKAMIYVLTILSKEWNIEKIEKRAMESDQPIYALMYAVLNNETLTQKDAKIFWENFFATAPTDGPCHNSPNCDAPLGWRSFDRWWHAEQKDGNTYGLPFEFSGLDYMLAYNLFHYYFASDLPIYKTILPFPKN